MRQALPSSSLFGQLRSRLSKEAWAAVKIDTLERTLLDLFNCTTIFSKMDDIKSRRIQLTIDEQDASPRHKNTAGVSRSDSDQSHDNSEPDVAFCEAMWSYFVYFQ